MVRQLRLPRSGTTSTSSRSTRARRRVLLFVYHVSGTLASGDAVGMWVRATLGVRRVDGDWRIVHDHESVPWDPQTGQSLIDLSPT